MKKILTLVFVFALCLVALNFLPVHGEEAIYNSVIRLHVIAASDSDSDQALKLKVRDAVLSGLSTLSEGCSSKSEAEEKLASQLDEIRAVALETLAAEGCDCHVSVSLGKEKYPQKSYDGVCFPAGEYTSLRIVIGEGEGKNWWCVAFPTLCMSATTEEFEAAAQTAGMDDTLSETLSGEPDYQLRFYLLDALGRAENFCFRKK